MTIYRGSVGGPISRFEGTILRGEECACCDGGGGGGGGGGEPHYTECLTFNQGDLVFVQLFEPQDVVSDNFLCCGGETIPVSRHIPVYGGSLGGNLLLHYCLWFALYNDGTEITNCIGSPGNRLDRIFWVWLDDGILVSGDDYLCNMKMAMRYTYVDSAGHPLPIFQGGWISFGTTIVKTNVLCRRHFILGRKYYQALDGDDLLGTYVVPEGSRSPVLLCGLAGSWGDPLTVRIAR